MRIDLLEVFREAIDADDPEVQERESLGYDQAVLAAAPDVFRQLKIQVMVLVYLYLIKNANWREVVEQSVFRVLLETALLADSAGHPVVTELRNGGRLTVAMLRRHNWPHLPGKINEAIDAAGGLFQMQVLLHNQLRPWVEELLPGFREEWSLRLRPGNVAELRESQKTMSSHQHAEVDQSPNELTDAVYGIYSVSLENHLERGERVSMIRIRKERRVPATRGTNADTIVFTRLTSAEEIEFCRSDESRRRIVNEKLRIVGERI